MWSFLTDASRRRDSMDDTHIDDRGVEARMETTPGLVGDVMAHATGLVRKEMDLLRAELQEEVNKAAAAVGMLAAALLLALVALNVLAAALVAWLTESGLDAGWSALIVGGALALIAIGLAMKGKNDLKLSSLAPTRTAKNVERDVKSVKEATNNG
jgi:uncharacterized membrane protein YqjE